MTAARGPDRYRLVLDRGRGSVRLARQLVGEQCRRAGLQPEVCDTAVLLTSEVVTNAFVHAGSEARLGVTADRRSVRVEVGDDSPRHPTVLPDVDIGAASGRGLWLVDLLAGAWGVADDDSSGKVVWFELSPA